MGWRGFGLWLLNWVGISVWEEVVVVLGRACILLAILYRGTRGERDRGLGGDRSSRRECRCSMATTPL